MSGTPGSTVQFNSRHQGDTASAQFVHALAKTLALQPGADIRPITLVAGPRAGQTVNRLFTTYDALARLVGTAVAPATLKAIVRKHPAIDVFSTTLVLVVDL